MSRLLLIGLIYLLPIVAYAQLDFGIKGGLNFSNLIDESTISQENWSTDIFSIKTSYNAGFIGEYKLKDKIGVGGEFFYNNKGARIPADSLNLNSVISLHYLSLNLYAVYQAFDRFGVYGGVEAGLLLDAVGKSRNKKWDYVFAKDYSFDLGPVIGIRFSLLKKILLDLRYNLSITRVVNNDLIFTPDGNSMSENYLRYRNQLVQLNVNFFFTRN